MHKAGCLVFAMLCGTTCLAADAEPRTSRSLEDGAREIAYIATDARQVARAQMLWSRALDAPLVLRDVRAGRALRIHADGTIAPVELPAAVPQANTCIDLHGEPTAHLLWPHHPSEDVAAKVWHERWHCAQPALGLGMEEGDNAHLDTEAGRRWLRLELRALAAAMRAGDADARRAAARDALVFRARRETLGPDVARNEALLERNEGLGEYTGRRVAAANLADLRARLVAELEAADDRPSYLRAFAYFTGPAYGALLDEASPAWRERLGEGHAPAALLADALGHRPDRTADDAAVAEAEARHGGGVVAREERERAVARAAQVARLRRALVEGPVLELQLAKASFTFNPQSPIALGDAGTVYEPLTVTDGWGRLHSTGPALLSKQWDRVRVEAGDAPACGRRIEGPGWTLELAEGWRTVREGAALRVVSGMPPPC